MKQVFVLMLLVSLLISCSPQGRGEPSLATREAENVGAEEATKIEPTSEQIDAVKSEMAEWAEGRWTTHSAMWSPEEGMFILSAAADPMANETEIKGYCRILDDIASKHLQGVKVSAAVFFPSGAKIECK